MTLPYKGLFILLSRMFPLLVCLTVSSTSLKGQPCQIVDSLALVDIYQSTNGTNWNITWNLNSPVRTWFGINLGSDGYVREIELNNNGLSGTLPSSIGNFKELVFLQLDNNEISGSLPDELGMLLEIVSLFLDDNQFSGSLPPGLGNLNKLQTLFIDNNNISGPVPQSFQALNNLMAFDCFNNNLDSLPDLTTLNIQWNRFGIYGNALTFDDILNNDLFVLNGRYTPQDSAGIERTETGPLGQRHLLDLGFDNGVTDNVYQWYKNGIPFGTPVNSNKLIFDPLRGTDNGIYHAVVTNPRADLLTLISRPITLLSECQTVRDTLYPNLCEGENFLLDGKQFNWSNPLDSLVYPGSTAFGCDSVILVQVRQKMTGEASLELDICEGDSLTFQGLVFDQDNPTGTIIIPSGASNGCDSLISVNTNFLQSSSINISSIICQEDSIRVGNEVFHSGRPFGAVRLDNQAANGCDSIIEIALTFHAATQSTLRETICQEDHIIIGGTRFDQKNPAGRVILTDADKFGCDSSVLVQLDFLESDTFRFSPLLCPGESRIVNGRTYSTANPAGLEVIQGAKANGCDSIVLVEVRPAPDAIGFAEPTICSGETFSIGGQRFDENRPSGAVRLIGASSLGCDSIVNVNISFNTSVEVDFTPSLCPGEFISIQGIQYSIANRSGTATFTGGAQGGCDSIVHIQVQELSPTSDTLTPLICPEETFELLGQIFDRNNPNGEIKLDKANFRGCDSIIVVRSILASPSQNIIGQTLCQGDEIMVNGTIYNETNPSGTEILSAAASNGCDSIIFVELDYVQTVASQVSQKLCIGESMIINGNVYNENNPTGTEIISNGSVSGCDSMIQVNLIFENTKEENIQDILCPGEFLMVNNIRYDESNALGTEILLSGSVNGCDSIINVQLGFFPIAFSSLDTAICSGEEIIINGSFYNSNNSTGQEIIRNASVHGCDSIINVELSFYEVAESTLDTVLCFGEEFEINETIYNASNTEGTETLLGTSNNGCDSNIQVKLTYQDLNTASIQASLCPEEELIYDGIIFNHNNLQGTFIRRSNSSNSCDTVVTVNILPLENVTIDINDNLCEGTQIELGGQIFNDQNTTGNIVLSDLASNGCDSILMVDLIVLPIGKNELLSDLCEGDTLSFAGQVFDQNRPGGLITLPGASVNSCDSIIKVDINWLVNPLGAVQEELCEGEEKNIHGEIFNASRPSGTITLEGSAANGCDSILLVQLAFSDIPEQNIFKEICLGDTLVIHNQSFTSAGNYSFLISDTSNCDTQINLEVRTEDPIQDFGRSRAGRDQVYCENEIILMGNLPIGTSGYWISIENPMDTLDGQQHTLRVEDESDYAFVYALSSDICGTFSKDTIIYSASASVKANNDTISVTNLTGDRIIFSPLENDVLPIEFNWGLLNQSEHLSRISEFELLLRNMSSERQNIFEYYQICDVSCPSNCDTARLAILIQIPSIELSNAITPNNDGKNDAFVIDVLELNPDKYPNASLLVFNRWGEVVYKKQPYINDWKGTNNKGEDLPEGTYYYILNLSLGQSELFKGDITIIR